MSRSDSNASLQASLLRAVSTRNEVLAELMRREALWPATGTNPAQQQFLEAPQKFRCFNAGFGAGKTYIGAQEAWNTARDHPGSLGLIVAPTYPQLRDYTQRTFFERVGHTADTIEQHELVRTWSKSEQHLILTNGSEILFRSADKPGTLIGSTVDWFWLDEPASCAASVWKMLLGRLRGKTGPRRGWATGTPEGFNWVYRTFAETPKDDYFLVKAATFDNPFLPDDYIEAMAENYGGAFARAYLYGDFVAFEGQVYHFDRAQHMTDEAWTPEPGLPIYRTADFGTNNPTAWLWIQEIAGTVYVFDELEVRRQPVDVIASEVKARWSDLMVADNYGDVAGTQRDSNLNSYVSNYSRAGIRIRTRSGGPVKAGIEVVTKYLEHGRLLVHPRCSRTIAAFETYHWPEDKDGQRVGDDPVKDGVSDHIMDALRYYFVNAHHAEFRRPTFGGAGAGSGGFVTPLPGGSNVTAVTPQHLAIGRRA